jgi:hypothetical protein
MNEINYSICRVQPDTVDQNGMLKVVNQTNVGIVWDYSDI